MATTFDRSLVGNIIRATKFKFFSASLSRERAVSMIEGHCESVILANTPEISKEDALKLLQQVEDQEKQRAAVRALLSGMKDMVSAHFDATQDSDEMLIANLEVEIDRALSQVSVDEDI